jgi:trk system potassium uptake protein TrkA
MKVTIIGAGEVGRGLAAILCGEGHQVVLVDQSSKLLKRVGENLDVITMQGNGVSGSILHQICPTSDLFVAASGDDTTNILACQLASHMGAKKTICRLSSEEYFDNTPNFLPSLLGINQIIIPLLECANKIVNIVSHRTILEKIVFEEIGAEITSFKLEGTFPLVGVRLRDFPDHDLLDKVRFCGIIRHGSFILPFGDTVFAKDDEVFVAGSNESVTELLEWVTAEQSVKKNSRVIIAGGTVLGKRIAAELITHGHDVRLIEKNADICDKILDELGKNLIVLNGDPTDREILDEAGIKDCPVYISVMNDDEDNIMSCMLAKKRGCHKTITIVKKSDYAMLFSSLDMIDSCFSPSAVGVNSALKFLEEEKSRVAALVHRANAFVFELKIEKKSPVCGMRIADCGNLPKMIFAFVTRQGVMLSAVGDLRFEEGDRITCISDFDSIKQLESYFYAQTQQ